MRYVSLLLSIFSVLAISITPVNSEDSNYEHRLVNLDKFIGAIEDKCNLSSRLQTFRSDLFGRYSFDRPKDQPRAIVRIPTDLRAAIGRASAIDRKSHTEIIVPLNGLYHGLETQSLIFSVGHGNGIAATMLVFKSDANVVAQTFKESVAATKKYLESDPDGKQMIMEIDLEKRSEGMALICDESN